VRVLFRRVPSVLEVDDRPPQYPRVEVSLFLTSCSAGFIRSLDEQVKYFGSLEIVFPDRLLFEGCKMFS
jgi:hypothetical protein